MIFIRLVVFDWIHTGYWRGRRQPDRRPIHGGKRPSNYSCEVGREIPSKIFGRLGVGADGAMSSGSDSPLPDRA